MASWWDEVETAMDSGVRYHLLPINAHLLVEVAIKLLVDKLSNGLPAFVIVDLVAETRCVCDCQLQTNSLFFNHCEEVRGRGGEGGGGGRGEKREK